MKKLLGIKEGNVRIIDVIQELARIEPWFIKRFGIDTLDIGSVYLNKDEDWYDLNVNGIEAQFPGWFQPRHNPDDSYDILHEDGTILGAMTKGAVVFDQTYIPFYDRYPDNFTEILKAAGKLMWVRCPIPPHTNAGEKGYWRKLRENALQLRKDTNKAIVYSFGGSIFQGPHAFRGMDKFLMDVVRGSSKAKELIKLMTDFYLANLPAICKRLGDVIDIITFFDDLGENKGPMVNPKLYRKYFKPFHEEMFNYVKKHSSMKIFFHSCGGIYSLIPDLIESGIDILNPVQINAKDMDPKRLKEEFGDDITFWGGGADTRFILNLKSPEEVKKHVMELLEIFAQGGGYIWNTVHNILADVPPQNILAMFEAIEIFNSKK